MSEASLPGRTPPHNSEAERSLLGAILIDPERISEAAELVRPESFFTKGHGLLFEVLLELSEKGTPVDPVTVCQALQLKGQLERVGGDALLLELMQTVTSSAHLVHYARMVAACATLRSLIGEATDIIASAYETSPEPEEVRGLLDRSENRIFGIAGTGEVQGAEPVSETIAEVFRRIDARSHRQGITGITTGYYDLDEMLCGFNGGDLIVIAARPSMGKTAFALNVVEHAALSTPDWLGQQPTVLLFSLEMGRLSLIERMLCSRARVEAYRLRTGRLSAEERDELVRAADELHSTRILFDDTPSLDIMSLRSRARRVRARFGLHMIVIDYLQLLSAPKSESRVQEISVISRGLKALARELEIPVIALAQLSRAVELRDPPRPQLADLRESGSIEQDADVVMFLYRPEYYAKYRDDEEKRGLAEVICAKHRNGPTGTVNLQFFPNTMRFDNRTVQESEPLSL